MRGRQNLKWMRNPRKKGKRDKLDFPRWVVVFFLCSMFPSCSPRRTPEVQITSSPQATQTPPPSPTAFVSPTIQAAATPVRSPSPIPTTRGSQPDNPSCTDREGEIVDFVIDSRTLGEPLTGKVYLPPCYGEEGHPYPALYLLHGAEASDEQWERIGINEVMDTMLADGHLHPFLVVMPREPSWALPPENRFGEAIVEDLVPWVDEVYATKAAREYRAIGGLSRGGNWALRVGLQHWQLFSAVGAHSAPVFFGDLREIPAWFDEIPDSLLPQLYLDLGEEDPYGEYTRRLREMLTDRGIPHEWHLYPGGHKETYWRDHLPEYLRWYSSTWGEERLQDTIR